MRKPNKSKEPEAVTTFKLVRASFQDIHIVDGKRTSERLKKQSGWVTRLRCHLFEKPVISYVYLFVGFIVLHLFGVKIVIDSNDVIVRILFCLMSTLLYFSVSIFLYLITPDPDMDYEERWKSKLRLIKNNLKEHKDSFNKQDELQFIKYRIQKSINYYGRNGEPVKFLLELMWGGIFIGCLPDKSFQEVLVFFPNIFKIWAINPFGTIALIFVLLIGPIYHFKYRIPKIWMEQVITQIELDNGI